MTEQLPQILLQLLQIPRYTQVRPQTQLPQLPQLPQTQLPQLPQLPQTQLPHAIQVPKVPKVQKVQKVQKVAQALPQCLQIQQSRHRRRSPQIVEFLQKHPRLDLLSPTLYFQTLKKLTKSRASGQMTKNTIYMETVRELIIYQKVKKYPDFNSDFGSFKNDLSKLLQDKPQVIAQLPTRAMTSNQDKLRTLYKYYNSLVELLVFLFRTPEQRIQLIRQRIRQRRTTYLSEDLEYFLKLNPINYTTTNSVMRFYKGEYEGKTGILCELNNKHNLIPATIEKSKLFSPFGSETHRGFEPMYFYTQKQKEVLEELYAEYCYYIWEIEPLYFVKLDTGNIILILK